MYVYFLVKYEVYFGLCMCLLRLFGQFSVVFCYLCVITIEKESCTNETTEKKKKNNNEVCGLTTHRSDCL